MKVCFVCPFAYPLFDPATPGRFGGSEVRAWLLGRGLARLDGYRVSFAVGDHGQPPQQQIDGVEVFAMASPASFSDRLLAQARRSVGRQTGFPWLRIERWHAGLAWQLPLAAACSSVARLRRAVYSYTLDDPPRRRALDQINADIYCSFGAHRFSAETISLCRRRGRKSVLLLSSDYDLSPQYYRRSRELNAYGELGHICHYCLAHADRIVVQTVWQQEQLRERFGRPSVLVANPIDLNDAPAPLPRQPGEGYALWIGKTDDLKRPERCLELAVRCPQIPFVLIMNRSDPQRFEALLSSLPGNVRVVERVSMAEMGDYFRRAAVLVNTSAAEGFPVAFLEAGKHHLPIVSLSIDPDGILTRHGCGMVAGGNIEAMAQALGSLWSDAERASELARNMRTYIEARHELGGRVRELDQVLKEVA